jgi:hypothetical protein
MRRITGATVSANLFGSGKDGFTVGNPPSPPATIVSDTWCNDVQENILNVIESNGITPGSSTTQLKDGIDAQISTRISSAGNLEYVGNVIVGATYTKRSLSISSQETNANGLAFKSDGKKFYIIGSNSDSVYQYSTPTAWNLTSASYDSISFNVSAQATNPIDIVFNAAGTKFFVINQPSAFQYSTSTPWVLTGSSYDGVSFNFTTQTTGPRCVVFNSTGTKMFVASDVSTQKIFQYTLPTPYVLTGATYDSVSLTISSQSTSPVGIAFSNNGDRIFVVDGTSFIVYEYNLPTNYILTGGSYSGNSFDLSPYSAPTGLVFSPNGGKMFVVGAAEDKIHEFYTSKVFMPS